MWCFVDTRWYSDGKGNGYPILGLTTAGDGRGRPPPAERIRGSYPRFVREGDRPTERPPTERHWTIFEAFDALEGGESLTPVDSRAENGSVAGHHPLTLGAIR